MTGISYHRKKSWYNIKGKKKSLFKKYTIGQLGWSKNQNNTFNGIKKVDKCDCLKLDDELDKSYSVGYTASISHKPINKLQQTTDEKKASDNTEYNTVTDQASRDRYLQVTDRKQKSLFSHRTHDAKTFVKYRRKYNKKVSTNDKAGTRLASHARISKIPCPKQKTLKCYSTNDKVGNRLASHARISKIPCLKQKTLKCYNTNDKAVIGLDSHDRTLQVRGRKRKSLSSYRTHDAKMAGCKCDVTCPAKYNYMGYAKPSVKHTRSKANQTKDIKTSDVNIQVAKFYYTNVERNLKGLKQKNIFTNHDVFLESDLVESTRPPSHDRSLIVSSPCKCTYINAVTCQASHERALVDAGRKRMSIFRKRTHVAKSDAKCIAEYDDKSGVLPSLQKNEVDCNSTKITAVTRPGSHDLTKKVHTRKQKSLFSKRTQDATPKAKSFAEYDKMGDTLLAVKLQNRLTSHGRTLQLPYRKQKSSFSENNGEVKNDFIDVNAGRRKMVAEVVMPRFRNIPSIKRIKKKLVCSCQQFSFGYNKDRVKELKLQQNAKSDQNTLCGRTVYEYKPVILLKSLSTKSVKTVFKKFSRKLSGQKRKSRNGKGINKQNESEYMSNDTNGTCKYSSNSVSSTNGVSIRELCKCMLLLKPKLQSRRVRLPKNFREAHLQRQKNSVGESTKNSLDVCSDLTPRPDHICKICKCIKCESTGAPTGPPPPKLQRRSVCLSNKCRKAHLQNQINVIWESPKICKKCKLPLEPKLVSGLFDVWCKKSQHESKKQHNHGSCLELHKSPEATCVSPTQRKKVFFRNIICQQFRPQKRISNSCESTKNNINICCGECEAIDCSQLQKSLKTEYEGLPSTEKNYICSKFKHEFQQKKNKVPFKTPEKSDNVCSNFTSRPEHFSKDCKCIKRECDSPTPLTLKLQSRSVCLSDIHKSKAHLQNQVKVIWESPKIFKKLQNKNKKQTLKRLKLHQSQKPECSIHQHLLQKQFSDNYESPKNNINVCYCECASCARSKLRKSLKSEYESLPINENEHICGICRQECQQKPIDVLFNSPKKSTKGCSDLTCQPEPISKLSFENRDFLPNGNRSSERVRCTNTSDKEAVIILPCDNYSKLKQNIKTSVCKRRSAAVNTTILNKVQRKIKALFGCPDREPCKSSKFRKKTKTLCECPKTKTRPFCICKFLRLIFPRSQDNDGCKCSNVSSNACMQEVKSKEEKRPKPTRAEKLEEKQIQKELDNVNKQDVEEHFNICLNCLFGTLVLVLGIVVGAVKILIYCITRPKVAYRYVKTKLNDLHGTSYQMKKFLTKQWVYRKIAITKAMRRSRAMTIMIDQFKESTLYTSVFKKNQMTNKERKADEAETILRRRRIRRRSKAAMAACDILQTLRRKPCIWVHYVSPSFYPKFLDLLQALHKCMHACLFLCAMCFWSPCIIGVLLCRTLYCEVL